MATTGAELILFAPTLEQANIVGCAGVQMGQAPRWEYACPLDLRSVRVAL